MEFLASPLADLFRVFRAVHASAMIYPLLLIFAGRGEHFPISSVARIRGANACQLLRGGPLIYRRVARGDVKGPFAAARCENLNRQNVS